MCGWIKLLVFLDEFGATTHMTRALFARGGRVGQRIVSKTPHGHWKLLSTIAAMNATGVFTGCTFDAAVNTGDRLWRLWRSSWYLCCDRARWW